MAYTPGDKYVTPTGIGLFNNLFGESQGGGPSNFFGSGGMFGDNPFASAQQAWARQMFGMGVAPATDQLNAAAQGSTDRYFGGNGENGWGDRWQQWFGTDVKGPDGQVLLSPQHQTGLRVGQDYGTTRRDDGSVTDPWHSDMFQAALGIRNNLNQDRWLDPYQTMEGMRALNQDSPYARPDPNDYLNTMSRAQGGPGQADYYGQRGVSQTDALASTNIRQLNRNIDRESQETLANQLPEVQQAMEAAGLGRSGAGQLQMLNAQKDILSQANRDKNRTMADYTDREANRQAAAINLGSQIGAQGYEGYAGRQGQAALQGLNDQFQMNQMNRQNEQALWSQQMQNRYTKNQGDQNALFQMLGQSGQYGLGELDAERMGQSQSLSDYMNLVNNREGWRTNSLNEMLGLSDRQRSIQQDILNQQMQAGFMPLDLMTRLTTGISGSNYSPQQSAPWWAGALNSAGSGVGKSLGEGAGSWLSQQFGNP